jgi:hypothetical protein
MKPTTLEGELQKNFVAYERSDVTLITTRSVIK